MRQGNLHVMHPAPSQLHRLDQIIDKHIRSIPGATDINVVEIDEQFLVDRTFRDAWELNRSNTLDINMVKARKIKLEDLRSRRNKKLQDSDVEYLVAIEDNDQVKLDDMKQKRKALRDLPQTIQPELDAAGTPEELKLVDSELLNG